MSSVSLCAVRGGPGSTVTRRLAFRRARDSQSTLHFVSVIDPTGYTSRHVGEQHAIRREMAWRDRTLARASRRSVDAGDVDFEVVVRVGDLAGVLAEYAREIGADRIMIGESRKAPDAALGDEGLAALVKAMGAAGLAVEVLARDSAEAEGT